MNSVRTARFFLSRPLFQPRNRLLKSLPIPTVCLPVFRYYSTAKRPAMSVQRTEEEWRAVLSPEQFHILRQSGTEPAGSGEYIDNKKQGKSTSSYYSKP